MRPIGVIGGMSAESTALYYERINAGVRAALGGLHSAELILWSVDFAPIAALQAEGRWDEAGARLAQIARRLERAGAQALLIATNTMHRVYDVVQGAVTIPVLHLADATGERVQAAGLRRPGLMATRFTMEQDFYVGRLRERFGLEPVIPSAEDRGRVHAVIYDELCRGEVREASRAEFEAIAARLVKAGADSLILGCTEVCLLLSQENVPVPVFDTTAIHAEAAVAFALSPEPALAAAE
jgi:aspartate racemase